jgi:putative ATP-dependent endonuclease of the OLD family
MHIESLHVRRFRCLEGVALDLGDMTALIGINGSGKSAVLRAVAAFYEQGEPIVPDDWFAGDTNQEMEVSLTFVGLSPDETAAFGRYVSPEGSMRVSRVWRLDDGRVNSSYHGYHLANPEFASVREADKSIRDLHNLLVDSGNFLNLAKVVRAEDSEPALIAWETQHPDRCTWIRDSGKFFGWAQVGGARLARASICVYVPAVRDARADAAEGRGSVLSRIVDLVIRGELSRNPDLANLRAETQDRFDRILANTKPVLHGVAEDLSSLMSRFTPGAEVLLDWTTSVTALPDWPSIEARLLEDGVDSPVAAKGHGLQRSFIVSLLQRLAELLSSEGGDDAVSAPAVAARHTLLLIEEPELYQHPLAARRFAAVLRQLTAGEGNTQVAYSTHSRDFISFDHFDAVRHFSKNRLPEQTVPATRVHSSTIAAVRSQLLDLWNLDPAVVTEDTTRHRLRTVMTPEVSEGFFARRVVLVEGDQDRALIEGELMLRGVDLADRGVAILPVGGKSSMDRAAMVFRGFDIPTYLVWDGDADHSRPEDAKQNRVLLTMCALPEVDFPATNIGSDAAVFRERIEAEIRGALGTDEYAGLLADAAEEVGLARGRDLMKTRYGCTAFLTLVRDSDRDIAILRQLCDQLLEWTT